MDEPTCSRCGYCCYFFADNKLRKCMYLVKLPSGKTLCRIYADPHRVGKLLYIDKQGKMTRCNLIDSVAVNYPSCPYNERKNVVAGKGLPMFKHRIKWIDKVMDGG